ncbi:hypothetical protein DPMN_091160 [Dreissena polymorpha]|uniref:Uncharacterized protein n=1 Tax=Dreissena polymorpha TaxID=45954 RepID=A0A9D4KZ26_DREPO|nr:hypothetical protein DPMN_091160 [Dreissena polymorpha]
MSIIHFLIYDREAAKNEQRGSILTERPPICIYTVTQHNTKQHKLIYEQSWGHRLGTVKIKHWGFKPVSKRSTSHLAQQVRPNQYDSKTRT